jgi:hypothetical protein
MNYKKRSELWTIALGKAVDTIWKLSEENERLKGQIEDSLVLWAILWMGWDFSPRNIRTTELLLSDFEYITWSRITLDDIRSCNEDKNSLNP